MLESTRIGSTCAVRTHSSGVTIALILLGQRISRSFTVPDIYLVSIPQIEANTAYSTIRIKAFESAARS